MDTLMHILSGLFQRFLELPGSCIFIIGGGAYGFIVLCILIIIGLRDRDYNKIHEAQMRFQKFINDRRRGNGIKD